MRVLRGAAVVVLALGVAACADTVSGPDTGDPIEASLTEVAQIASTDGMAARPAGVVSLHALFRTAVLQVRDTEGVAAARALLEPIREAARAARELRRAGDREGFHAAMQTVHAAQAAVIVDVLGTEPVARALDAAAARLAAMQARVDALAAAGQDVTVHQARLDQAAQELAAARDLMATDPAAALLKALFFGPRGPGSWGGRMGG